VSPRPDISTPSATGEALVLLNPGRRDGGGNASPSRDPLRFHQRLPGYEVTRLISLDEVASEVHLDRLLLKDESYRLGIPSFKVLGVSWAAYRLLGERCGTVADDWTTLADLREAFSQLEPLTLLTATGGNHGRAVARVARWFGCAARILVPQATPAGRIAGLRAEGAEVVVIEGSYDDAVEAAAGQADDHSLLIQDTASSIDEVIPSWIVEGYSTIFWELDRQLEALDEPGLDLVIVQIGVGSLAGAAAAHFGGRELSARPTLVGVEPLSAAGVFESARAGELRVDGPGTSMMDCINAGKPSVATLDALLAGFDIFTAVDDEQVPAYMRALAQRGVVAGTTGVAGLVGLAELRGRVDGARSALVINTEGAADLAGYASALLS
jgi:diaminopropionate ammonia-lyase